MQKLKENADNILDITGTVTGHVLVLGCGPGSTVVAHAFSSDDTSTALMSLYQVPNEVIPKYGVGPVTFEGKQYTMDVQAFGTPPGTTNVDVDLDPVEGDGGRIGSGNTLVGGSVAIAVAGSSTAYTFDHAVLELENAPSS